MRYRALSILTLVPALSLTACVPQDDAAFSGRAMRPESAKRLNEIAQSELQRGDTTSIRFQAQLIELGEVPYDAMTVPLVSPDGRTIATSVGMQPEPSTLLAEPGSPSPLGTGVEIWTYDLNSERYVKAHQLDPPLLLGRSADTKGFLVESPLPSGARHIGKVDWSTGQLTWLIDDEHVNAFATMGPEGQLAYSSRSVDESNFSLIIQQDTGDELVIGADDGTWLFPTWSTRNNRLYTFWLSPTNRLQIATMLTISPQAMSSSIKKLDLGPEHSPTTAWRAIAMQPVVQGLNDSSSEELAFWHPGEKRTVIWNQQDETPFVLLDDALVATHDVSGRYLVATPDELRYVDPSRMHRSVRLHDQVAIPRATTEDTGVYILLTPGEDRVTVRGLAPTNRTKTQTTDADTPAS
jgi:hypothetical protein